MPVRLPVQLSVFAAALVAAVVSSSGCGGSSSGDAGPGGVITGTTLTVYSSLPLRGPLAEASQAMVNGQKLALEDVQGKVGDRFVKFVSLDDAAGPTGWDRGTALTNAREAAKDPSAIAYIGDADFGATAISIPILNAAGVGQVSPAAAYPGFTRASGTGEKGEPEKYYPSGLRTFARVIPSDIVQGRAQAAYQASAGCHATYILDDKQPDGLAVADAVQAALPAVGVRRAGRAGVQIGPSADAGLAAEIRGTGADCVFVGVGDASEDPLALWRVLHAGLPAATLFGPSLLAASSGFLHALTPTEQAATRLTRPVVGPSAENAQARALQARYIRTFGRAAPPEMVFGYEAMAVVLDALRAAGPRAGDRAYVAQLIHRVRRLVSTLGPYAIRPVGDTTLQRYAGWTVAAGAPVYDRVVLGR